MDTVNDFVVLKVSLRTAIFAGCVWSLAILISQFRTVIVGKA